MNERTALDTGSLATNLAAHLPADERAAARDLAELLVALACGDLSLQHRSLLTSDT